MKAQDKNGLMPLHFAAKNDKAISVVAYFVDEAKMDVDSQTGTYTATDSSNFDLNARTPLLMAARSGCLGVMKALLDRGANANYVQPTGDTALMHSIWASHAGSVASAVNLSIQQLLLDVMSPKIVTRRNSDGWTALSSALWYGRSDLAKLLLNRFWFDLKEADPDGLPPIARVITDSHFALIKALADAGANPNAPSNDGERPLEIAIRCQASLAVERLVAAGADCNKPTSLGVHPLDVAECLGLQVIVETLLRNGATHSPDRALVSIEMLGSEMDRIKNSNDVAVLFPVAGALQLAVMAGDFQFDVNREYGSLPLNDNYAPIIDLLKDAMAQRNAGLADDAGADASGGDRGGRLGGIDGVLHDKSLSKWASGVASAMSSLVELDIFGRVMTASSGGKDDPSALATVLRGCRLLPTLNMLGETGETALHLAARSGNAAVANLLVHHGADPNVFEKATSPALFLAVKGESLPLVKLLLEAKTLGTKAPSLTALTKEVSFV